MQSSLEPLIFRIEKSRSRSSKHIYTSSVFVFKKAIGLMPYTKCSVSEEKIKSIYAVGEAKLVKIKPDHGDFILHVYFVKNYLNRIKGSINVYNHRGELLFRAKYINGFLVKSKGSSIYAWLVRLLFDLLKIPIKETKLGDER
ncbi:MAG: hypothetical protein QXE81_01135 [Desulfurococcaceae archaeon]